MPHAARDHRSSRLKIEVANRQSAHAVDERQLIAAVESIIQDAVISSAEISIAVVDDATIHDLNNRYLGHDWPTDVLSFVLNEDDSHLEGEIVLSADTAASAAAEVGWPATSEQLLYVIHGALHLVGFDDHSPLDAQKMRDAEARYLQQFALAQPVAPNCQADAGRAIGLTDDPPAESAP